MKPPAEFTAEDRQAAGWIAAMATGEERGLTELYGLYHRPLLSFLVSILQDGGEAEEVLQDLFVRAYRAAARYDPALGTPFAWLATIGRRLAIDCLRKRRRRPALESNQREHPAVFADKHMDDKEAYNGLDASWLRDQLGGLPQHQREALVLAFLRGHTHFEIAALLKRPLGTVKSDLRRGLMQLRKAYQDNHEG